MKKFLLIAIIVLNLNIFAQDDPPPPPQNTWLPNGVLG